MAVELFANMPQTTLNGGINASVTSLVVTSATLFSVISGSQQFRILIDSEIMLVTATAGTTFTVTRGQENTTAATHANGAAIFQIMTTGALAQMKKDAQGWITATDYDFTAQGAQALATDTTYAIGGVTWTKVGSTHDNTAMAMSTANGLRMQPKGDTSNYNNNTWTAAGLRLQLNTIIPDIAFGMQLRVTAWNSGNNSAANFDAAVLAVDYTNNYNYYLQRGFNSAQRYYGDMGVNGVSQAGPTDTVSWTDDTMQLVLPSLGDSILRTRTGTYAAGFPADNAMLARAQLLSSTLTRPYVGVPSNWYVSLYALRVSSATALVVDWKRLRVDYRY